MCSLTDPLIWDNETILMEVTVRGSYPGNMFDMTPYVQLSDTSDNFTANDIYRYRRSIRITTTGALPVCRLYCSSLPLVWGSSCNSSAGRRLEGYRLRQAA